MPVRCRLRESDSSCLFGHAGIRTILIGAFAEFIYQQQTTAGYLLQVKGELLQIVHEGTLYL